MYSLQYLLIQSLSNAFTPSDLYRCRHIQGPVLHISYNRLTSIIVTEPTSASSLHSRRTVSMLLPTLIDFFLVPVHLIQSLFLLRHGHGNPHRTTWCPRPSDVRSKVNTLCMSVHIKVGVVAMPKMAWDSWSITIHQVLDTKVGVATRLEHSTQLERPRDCARGSKEP